MGRWISKKLTFAVDSKHFDPKRSKLQKQSKI